MCVLGFAFYLTPMVWLRLSWHLSGICLLTKLLQVMPLLAELPQGPAGVQTLSTAITITVMIIAVAVYFSLGVFAAARCPCKLCCFADRTS